MKKNINEIFDEATAKDLDIMLGDDFTDEPIDPVMLKRLERRVLGKKKEKTSLFRRMTAAVAACVVLTATISGGVYAYAAEAKEYRAAVNFFDEYNLSDAGLTRSEIKKVYRDISSESFSYSKTAEVIKSSVYEGDIEGYEISSESPSPESIAEFWNSSIDYSEIDGERAELILPDELGKDPVEFVVSGGGEELWRVTFDIDYLFTKWAKLDNGYVVFGRGLGVWDSVIFAYISADGQLQYIKNLDFIEDDDPMNFALEDIEAVFSNNEGGIIILGSALDTKFYEEDKNYLFIVNVDAFGNVLSTNTTEIEWMVITGATQAEDGYLLQVTNDTGSKDNIILKVDYDGNQIGCIGLGENNYIHNIMDMAEIDGNLYISSYVTGIDDRYTLQKNITSAYMSSKMDNSDINISEEELLARVKENYTAMLLVCDIEAGSVKKFYSVDGAVGARLTVSDTGDIVWDVKNIIEADVKHYYEIFTLNTRCSVSRYLIDNGEVSSIEDTSKYSTHSNQYYRSYTKEEIIEQWKEKFGDIEDFDSFFDLDSKEFAEEWKQTFGYGDDE